MLISYLITTRNLTLCLIIRYNTSVCRKINKRRNDFELLCRKFPVAHPYMCHKFIGCLLLGSITSTEIKASSQDSRSQTGDTRSRCLAEDQHVLRAIVQNLVAWDLCTPALVSRPYVEGYFAQRNFTDFRVITEHQACLCRCISYRTSRG